MFVSAFCALREAGADRPCECCVRGLDPNLLDILPGLVFSLHVAHHYLHTRQVSLRHVLLQLIDRRLFQRDAVARRHGE